MAKTEWISLCYGSDTIQIRLTDVSGSEAKHLFNGGFFDFYTEAVQHRILSGNHALVYTELFCPTAAFHRLFVVDIQNVHSAISDVCQKIRTFEITQIVDDGRITLWE